MRPPRVPLLWEHPCAIGRDTASIRKTVVTYTDWIPGSNQRTMNRWSLVTRRNPAPIQPQKPRTTLPAFPTQIYKSLFFKR